HDAGRRVEHPVGALGDRRRARREGDARHSRRLLRRRRRRVGAAVGVLEAVLGLGLVGTLVVLVEDAVAVVVGVGAAVGVLEAVLVLRLVGALVLGVGDAVAVGVLGRRRRRSRRGRRRGRLLAAEGRVDAAEEL